MKVSYEQFARQLQSGLAPVYLISGDEPLLVQESFDHLRNACVQAGFSERVRYHVDSKFDWLTLSNEANSLSLFAEKKLIELRMPTGKPGKQGAEALLEYMEAAPEDNVLVVVCNKLDAGTTKTKWVKAIESNGVWLPIWPVDRARLPQWIQQRLKRHDIEVSRDAIQLLVDRVEGNLLAAAQEIEKLSLLGARGRVDVEQMAEVVMDSARYNLFELVDVMLEGDLDRSVRMLNGLRAEGAEPVLILWGMAREIRLLRSIAQSMAAGMRFDQACSTQKVWPKRKALIQRGLQRHSAASLSELLLHCAEIDRVIKGIKAGRVWDELVELCAKFCGQPIINECTRANAG